MTRFLNHYKKIICYDLLTKFCYNHNYNLPKITQITLSLNDTQDTKKTKLIDYLYLIKKLTGIQSKSTVFIKNKPHFKVKKHVIVGCKINLFNNNMYQFFEYLILILLPKQQQIKPIRFSKKNPIVLNLYIKNWNNLKNTPEMQINFTLFSKSIRDSKILLNSFNLPITKD